MTYLAARQIRSYMQSHPREARPEHKYSLAQFGFTDAEMAQAGFTTVKFMTADVVLENYGCGATNAFFLNTKYFRLRPHKDRNMVPLGAKRLPVNQDASVSTLAWAGNLTCSNASLQGRLIGA